MSVDLRRKLQRADEVETLEAWADLLNAIQCVECALPTQMTAAIIKLIEQRSRFDDLMCGRVPPTLEKGKE